MWEGAPDYPHKGIWWELVERYRVTILYCAPTAIRACIKWGAEWPRKHDLSSLRLLGSVGEPINPKAWLWYHKVIGAERCPIVDTWWQTETGAIMITPLPGITKTKPGSATDPFPGVFAEVLDESTGEPLREGPGSARAHPPVAVDAAHPLQGAASAIVETYFARFGRETYLVGDAARRDRDGYLWVIGRIDDVVNVSGHRLSTAEVESAIVAHPDVAEAAVIGQHDEETGQAIVAFVTLQGDLAGDEQTVEGIRATVAERIGKFARPKRIIWADDLPKTRSGKIMRRLLRDIAEGRALGDVTTLRDPAVTVQLEQRVQRAPGARGLRPRARLRVIPDGGGSRPVRSSWQGWHHQQAPIDRSAEERLLRARIRVAGAGRLAPTPQRHSAGRSHLLRRAVFSLLGVAATLAVLHAVGVLHPPDRHAIGGIVLVVAALLFLIGPWFVRLARSLSAERAARIREQERAELAAHLHDSVLQTLALIQRRAGDAREVAALARRQERELRRWLFERPGTGTQNTVKTALQQAAAEVEERTASRSRRSSSATRRSTPESMRSSSPRARR